jgi:hypothetical protein
MQSSNDTIVLPEDLHEELMRQVENVKSEFIGHPLNNQTISQLESRIDFTIRDFLWRNGYPHNSKIRRFTVHINEYP